MKKELALHFLTSLILCIPIFILRYFSLSNWPFLVGSLIGTFLPDIDHIIYVYYLRPYEVTSQHIMYMAQKGNLKESWNLLATTRSERSNLILHTILFQIIFLALSFFVTTSSSSLLGKGLVLTFLLHLFVDEVLDIRETANLTNWLKNIPFEIDRMQLNIYLIANLSAIFIFSFLI